MRTRALTTPAAIRAVSSPARQELMAVLGDGPASVRELAERLGRSPQAVHHHVAALQRAGVVAAVGARGAGVKRAQVFGLTGGRFAVRPGGSKPALEATGRAIESLLRQTSREAVRTVARPGVRLSGAGRELVVLRGKARLSPRQLARVNSLIDQLHRALASVPGGTDEPLFALTIVLTPSPDRARA